MEETDEKSKFYVSLNYKKENHYYERSTEILLPTYVEKIVYTEVFLFYLKDVVGKRFLKE